MQHSNCGVPRVAGSCSIGQASWIPLQSQAPGEIIAAARKSSLFNVDRSGTGDYIKDLSHLDVPRLVLALRPAGWTTETLPDYFVIPILGNAGTTIGAAELALNPSHTAIHVVEIVTYTTPLPHDTIGRRSQADSIAAVASQHHVGLRAGAQPELVYFPVSGPSQQAGKITWLDGSEYPADPVWLVPGADGKDHVVGVHGHAFYTTELPMMPHP